MDKKHYLKFNIKNCIMYGPFGVDKLFLFIIIINLIGSVYFFKTKNSSIYISIIYGLIGYLIGYALNGKCKKIKVKIRNFPFQFSDSARNNTKAELITIRIMFILSFALGFSLFFERGIPLFNPFDNALRSSFGDGTFGRIRFLCVGMPLMTILIFIVNMKTGKYRFTFIIMLSLTLIGLAFYSFKAYILWFAIAIFYTYYYFQKSKGNSLHIIRWLFISLIIFVILVVLFAIWLDGHDTALSAFLNRILYDELSGFNYIYQEYVPWHGYSYGEFILSEIKKIILRLNTEGYTYMDTLAYLYYGRRVTWGIVMTIYGAFYIDFGNIGVLTGLMVFGFLLKSIDDSLNHIGNKTNISLAVKIFYIPLLGFIFQNGSIVNEIRGTFLSLVTIYIIYNLILNTIWRITSINRFKMAKNMLQNF